MNPVAVRHAHSRVARAARGYSVKGSIRFSGLFRKGRIIRSNSIRIDAVSVSFLIRKSTAAIISFSAATIGMNGRAWSSIQ
ncbi:hypothetical protein A8E97_17365 [Burkholderia cenocepacia]|nr:hypothetical protein A8E88_01265 [Burkholderia cenocepacia]ONV81923.1 hypothetical protein A8E89_31055 [Burkholderia cenocepacia]ONW11682.1 hypothetical protein A8E94_20685 [Burkholderia cenocepacia]ONW16037.1 hypothetical protein A8E90_18585 [Burkholderia cenocepacia]ONW41930.1 hypothetical protein A8E92_31440 [Burkholderia cenocepacia]